MTVDRDVALAALEQINRNIWTPFQRASHEAEPCRRRCHGGMQLDARQAPRVGSDRNALGRVRSVEGDHD